MRTNLRRDLIVYSARPSDGGRLLARELGCRYVREGSRIRSTNGALIINWGNSNVRSDLSGQRALCLNPPEGVQRAISKVESYRRFQEAGVPTFEFTTEINQVRQWQSGGGLVLQRRDGLAGGKGIQFLNPGDAGDAAADFYTKYFPKTHEYRVHVFLSRPRTGINDGPGAAQATQGAAGEGIAGVLQQAGIIDITQKKRLVQYGTDTPGNAGNRTLHQRVIRSLENGWVHAHEDLHLPPAAREQIVQAAINAVRSIGLDFGAVDILVQYSKKRPQELRKIAVAEVNTAPGLGNQRTITAYVSAVNQAYEATRQERYIAPKPKRRKVQRLVRVQILTKKGNRVWRDRLRWVYE